MKTIALALTCLAPGLAQAASAAEILGRMMDVDPWGLGGAEVAAHVVVTRGQQTHTLAFTIASRRLGPGLAKVLVRFNGPPELAGAGLLLIQNATQEDERFLFLPEQKRSRRIPNGSRAETFLGTDFTFADLDRRDLRDGVSALAGEESLGDVECYRVDVTPKGSPYARVRLWISEDNFLPLRLEMYGADGQLLKTLVAEEVRRVSHHWYVARSRMTDARTRHETEWVLDDIAPRDDLPDAQFTVRELEKR